MRTTCWLLLLTCVCSPAHAAGPRTWTDRTGVFSVEAELVDVRGDYVQLKKTDGRLVDVPLKQLSQADREYLRRERASATATPPSARAAEAGGDAPVRAAVDKPIALEFVETPLEDVADFLSDRLAVDVVLDRRAMNNAGIDPATRLSGQSQSVSAGEALDRLLEPAGLTWLVRHEVLWITTKEEAQAAVQPRVYRLRRRLTFDDLIQDVTRKIAPQSWSDVGGPASISPVPPGVVIVSQTRKAHEQIERHYADLLEPIPTPPPGFPPRFGESAVVRALVEPTQVEFVEAPLRDVVDFLADRHDIEIALDEPALAAAGLAADTPVTARLKKVTLGAALSILASPLDLSWTVDQRRLLVTTPKADNQRLLLISYPTDKLGGPAGLPSLVDALRQTVAPAAWDRVGGPGTIRSGIRGTLDVRQTLRVHLVLAGLLEALRQAQGR